MNQEADARGSCAGRVDAAATDTGAKRGDEGMGYSLHGQSDAGGNKQTKPRRTREYEGERRMSSGSKRTLAQMSKKLHDDSISAKKSDGKVYRRSSYKIANKPSSSPRNSSCSSKRISHENSVASSTRASTDSKSTKLHKSTIQDRTRLSVHGKGRRHGKDREPSGGSKVGTPSMSSSQKKFPESLGEAVHEGPLKSKNTFVEGKYSVDRAWKNAYAVLRGHCLCLHPDKNSQSLVVYDHPISIGSALVDIAYDYTKKPHVFRVTTLNFSEFLFEATSSELMLEWICVLQKQGLAYSQDFLKRKILSSSLKLNKSSRMHSKGQQKQQALSVDGPSPSSAAMMTTAKQSSSSSSTGKQDFLHPSNFLQRFRSRSPEGRKFKSETTSPGPTNEIKVKTWREKVAERFKRANSHPGTSARSAPGSVNPLSPPDRLATFPPIKDSGEDQPGKAQGCLGIPLDKCIASPNNEHLPLLVETCIDIIESQGLNNKGIYRVPGNSAAISTLQSQVEKDPVTLNRDHEKWNDTNAVVSLLKLFFRKLPEPLVTKELYQSFIEANHTEEKKQRLIKIKKLIHMLPMCNFETFGCLAMHLNKVAMYEKTNMMDARNLAIVFGPTLLQPAQDKNMVNMVKDMNDQCQIVESIISHHQWFFGPWSEDVPFLGDDATRNEPVTSMESQLIEKAQKHLEMSASGGSKKGRFTSLVSQSSMSKAPKKETESSSKGMTVFSVESVYCDLENSAEHFDSQQGLKSKAHEKTSSSGSRAKGENLFEKAGGSGKLDPPARQERISRKKFREDLEIYKSVGCISDEACRLKRNHAMDVSAQGRPSTSKGQAGTKKSDPSETLKLERISKECAMRRGSHNVGDSCDRKVLESKVPEGNTDFSSGDSCFIDCTSDVCNEPQMDAGQHSSHQGERGALAQEKNDIKCIPSSSLLQPPRMQFRSRSSQRHLRKISRRDIRDLSCQIETRSPEVFTGSLELVNKCTTTEHEGEVAMNSGSNFKTPLDIAPLKHAPSEPQLQEEIPGRNEYLCDVHLAAGEARTWADMRLFSDASLEADNSCLRESISDNVFDDHDNNVPEDVVKMNVVECQKLSMSADFLFPKIGNFLKEEEQKSHCENPLSPFKTDFKPKQSRMFLSLHSLKSPKKHKNSIQKNINSNTNRDMISELHLHLDLEPVNADRPGKRDIVKDLVRTRSSTNCFIKEGLSSPSRETRGSMSYESSV